MDEAFNRRKHIIQHSDHETEWVNWVLLLPFWQVVVGQEKATFCFLLNPICSFLHKCHLEKDLRDPGYHYVTQ